MPMHHAMQTPDDDPALAAHPQLTVVLNGFTYTLTTKDGHSTYSVSDGTNTLSLPVRWIFGLGSQTLVLEKDGWFYESMVTYFPREQVLGATPGDEKIVPQALNQALGRPLPMWEVRSCFNCHATGALKDGELALDQVRPGVECGRCHEGAQQHMIDAARDNFKTLPRPLGRMPAEKISTFCGQCHRSWDTVVRNHWEGEPHVRFQPYRLELSQCFSGNDPRISCVACHNPHQPVKHDDAFYDAKCTACHSSAKAAASSGARVCPVSQTKCVSCHMPKVELAASHASFTDHYIRIVRPGEPYPY